MCTNLHRHKLSDTLFPKPQHKWPLTSTPTTHPYPVIIPAHTSSSSFKANNRTNKLPLDIHGLFLHMQHDIRGWNLPQSSRWFIRATIRDHCWRRWRIVWFWRLLRPCGKVSDGTPLMAADQIALAADWRIHACSNIHFPFPQTSLNTSYDCCRWLLADSALGSASCWLRYVW